MDDEKHLVAGIYAEKSGKTLQALDFSAHFASLGAWKKQDRDIYLLFLIKAIY